jgi:hypothetical protein
MIKLPRTGSTYLAHLLRSHPRISFHHEYLNPYATRKSELLRGPLGMRGARRIVHWAIAKAKWRSLSELLGSETKDRSIVGASINPFKEGLTESALGRVINPATRVIVLSRENLLKQHISHLNVLAEKAAGTTRPYKSYSEDGRPTDRRFHLGADSLAEIEKLENQRRALFALVEAVEAPKLFLTYEAHVNVADKEPTLELLARFLDVDIPPGWREEDRPAKGVPRYHKLVSDDLRRVIENYDEIAANAAIAKFL